jgi:peptide methionine sulfoxide reductase MsrA
VGTQYRSAIFVHDQAQRAAAERSTAAAQEHWGKPIVTEITPLEVFWPAEAYHQDYFARNPHQGYCQVVIDPKLRKLRQKFAARLRA